MIKNLKKIASLYIICVLLIPFAHGLETEALSKVNICFSTEDNNMPSEAKNLMKTLISRALKEYENERKGSYYLTVFIEDSSPEEDFERCEGELPQKETIYDSYRIKYEHSEDCHYILILNLEENDNRGFWFVRSGNCKEDQETFSLGDVFSLETNQNIKNYLKYTWLEMDNVLKNKREEDNLKNAGPFERTRYFFRKLIEFIIKATPKPADIQKKCIEAFGEFPSTKASHDVKSVVEVIEETPPRTVAQTQTKKVDVPEKNEFVYESYLSYFFYEVPDYASTIYSTILTTNHILETILNKTSDSQVTTPTQNEEDTENQEPSQTDTPVQDEEEIEQGWLTIIGEVYLYEEDGEQKLDLPNNLHWPGGASGVTIGIGYDMKNRDKAEVFNDLTEAGMDDSLAERISCGAGLEGNNTKEFVNNNKDIEINDDIILNLFQITYQEIKEKTRLRATSTNPYFSKWSDTTADGKDVEIALGVNARAMEIQQYINENQKQFPELITTESNSEEKFMKYQYWRANKNKINKTVEVGRYVIPEELWNSLHPAIIELLIDLKYQGGTYSYKRVAKVNEAILSRDNTLDRLKALLKLFTPEEGEEYSFFDKYLINNGFATSTDQQTYFCKEVSWRNKIRRNIIRKTYLECIIKYLEEGKDVIIAESAVEKKDSAQTDTALTDTTQEEAKDNAEKAFDSLIAIIKEQLKESETKENHFFTIRIDYKELKEQELGNYKILFEKDGLKLVSEDNYNTIIKKEPLSFDISEYYTNKKPQNVEIANYYMEQCGLDEFCIQPTKNLEMKFLDSLNPLFNFEGWYQVTQLQDTENICE